MQKAPIAIVCLIIGLIIGSWIPRSELRILKEEIEGLRQEFQDCQKSKSEPSLMENVTSMLGMSGSQATKMSDHNSIRSDRSPVPKPVTSELVINPVEDQDGLPPDDIDIEISNAHDEKQIGEEGFQMKLEAARDLWKTRSAHARELLREELVLDEEEIRGFDNVITSINNRLEEEIAALASSVQYEDRLGTEDGAKIANRITGVLIDSYAELDAVFPTDWRENTTQETDIVNFIDPMVAAPFAQMYQPPMSQNSAEVE